MRRLSLTIGARGSRLSLAQAAIVEHLLRTTHPGLQVDVRVIKTEGDRRLETPLPFIGGKGVFTEAIEEALLSGAVDVAIHSLKDLPVQQRDGLTIGAVPPRAAVADVLIGRPRRRFHDLAPRARVGTSSLRRATQLRLARPDLEPVSIRGNVETRLRKLSDPREAFDAIILARAGLDRLNLLDAVSEELSLDIMLPAPGQGALAVQCRTQPDIEAMLAPLNHPLSAMATGAERAFLAALGGGCATPVAALGTFEHQSLRLRGRVLARSGREAIDVDISCACASNAEAEAIGQALATMAIGRGAAELLRTSV